MMAGFLDDALEYQKYNNLKKFAQNDLPAAFPDATPQQTALIKYAAADPSQLGPVVQQLTEQTALSKMVGGGNQVPGVPAMPVGITQTGQAPNLAAIAANPGSNAPPPPTMPVGQDNGSMTSISPSNLSQIADQISNPAQPTIGTGPAPEAPPSTMVDRLKQALPYLPKEIQGAALTQMMTNPMMGGFTQPAAPAATTTSTPQTSWQNNPAINAYGPAVASMTKAVLSGAIPYSEQLKNSSDPTMKMAMLLAPQVDPNFTASTAKVRSDTAENFDPKNKNGQLMQSMGTAAGHMADLLDAYKGIQNSNNVWVNTPANLFAGASGNPRNDAIKSFKTIVNGLAPEQAKIVSGNPQVAEGEINQLRDSYDPNQAPSTFTKMMRTNAQMIKDRADAMMEQYHSAMGPLMPPTAPKLSPRVVQNFKELGVDMSAYQDPATKAQAQPQGSAPNLSRMGNAPIAPKGAVKYDPQGGRHTSNGDGTWS